MAPKVKYEDGQRGERPQAREAVKPRGLTPFLSTTINDRGADARLSATRSE